MKKIAFSIIMILSAFTASNAEELNITANGIGLGTSNPSKPLHVVGNKPFDAISYMHNISATGYSGVEFRTAGDEFGGFFGYGNELKRYLFVVEPNGYYAWRFDQIGDVMTLTSDGALKAKSFHTDAGPIADYVFDDDYQLMPLDDLQAFIAENKHLPNVTSQRDVNNQGYIDLKEFTMKTLEKTEELTLYILELNQAVNSLKEENRKLSDQLNSLEAAKY